MMKRFSLALLALLLVSVWATGAFAKNEARTIQDATNVLTDVMKIPEKGIPPALLKDAKAVAIIPGVIKGAFMVGGRHGTGVILVRQENGLWSDPLFLSITGGSVGWQVGATATDLILVFKSLKGVESLMKGKFTLGADASVAAGPVGRSAEAATDVMLKSEILSYSRSKGLFAGVALEGAALLIDEDANAKYYGKKATTADVASGKFTKRARATSRLKQILSKYASGQ